MADVKSTVRSTISENIKNSIQLISEHLSGEQELEDLKEEAERLETEWSEAYSTFGETWGGKIDSFKAKIDIALQREKKRKQKIALALNSD